MGLLGGQMALRWCTAGMVEAVAAQFLRVIHEGVGPVNSVWLGVLSRRLGAWWCAAVAGQDQIKMATGSDHRTISCLVTSEPVHATAFRAWVRARMCPSRRP
jgi:hypothetical protein